MFSELEFDLESILKKGLDLSPDCFGILNQDDVVVYCNDTFAGVFGMTKEAAIGKKNKELLRFAWSTKQGIRIETDDFATWYQNIDVLHKEKLLNQFETDLLDGRWFKMTRINIGNGYILLFGVNITDLKKTQLSLESANQKIEVLANTDQLTTVNNRRSFNVIAEQAFKNAIRYQQSLSLLLLDLDFFKQVNDTYGHESGDLVLKEFAQLCHSLLRKSDSLARVGGEEFTILLPMTDSLGACKVAEYIRAKVEAHDFYIKTRERPIKITVSIGISSLTDTKLSVKDLLVQADQALYRAKKNGRNQAVQYE